MARLSVGPWFRVSESTWYATIDGRKVSLGVKGKGAKQAAGKAWLRLLSGQAEAMPAASSVDLTVKSLADAFLDAR